VALEVDLLLWLLVVVVVDATVGAWHRLVRAQPQ
jgi:hypothetical protein